MLDYDKIIDTLWREICIPQNDNAGNVWEYPQSVQEAASDAISAIEELLKKVRWISVEEDLPDNDERVLVRGPKGGIQICRYWEGRDYGGSLQYMFINNKQSPAKVTHWMRLPDAVGGRLE